jgi:hypothetical protein
VEMRVGETPAAAAAVKARTTTAAIADDRNERWENIALPPEP